MSLLDTMTRRLQRHRRRQEGQALALGSVTMLLVALMLLMTLSVGQATHERIRLQAHTDAIAYSQAVEVARSFNYFAYSNRAIAGVVVSMTVMHAWMSIASLVPSIWEAGAMIYIFVMIMEFSKVCMHSWCMGIKHIFHGLKALQTYNKYKKEAKNARNRLKQLDGKFIEAIDALSLMLTSIKLSQTLAKTFTQLGLMQGLDEAKFKNINAKQADEKTTLIGALNVQSYRKALDDNETRKQSELTEMANGSRWIEWISKRGDFAYNFPFIHITGPAPKFLLKDKAKLKPIFAAIIPFTGGGKARAIKTNEGSVGSGDHRAMPTGVAPASEEKGPWLIISSNCTEHFPPTMVWSTEWAGGKTFIRSDPEGAPGGGNGRHTPNNVHQGQHKVNRCLAEGGCFVKYDPNPSSVNSGNIGRRIDNQPYIYAGTALRLNLMNEGSGPNPWEPSNGTMGIATNTGGTTFHVTPQSDGCAVSKAMVYYHRPNHWQEAPNMWNPFWRVKLHPWTRGGTDAAVVGAACGDGVAAWAAAVP